MKINYEMLKKFDDVEIYRNVDEFYKMQCNCMIDNTFNNIDEIFNLSCDIEKMYKSYEHFKKQIIVNNIENYIIICDFEHEKIFLCENVINDYKWLLILEKFSRSYVYEWRGTPMLCPKSPHRLCRALSISVGCHCQYLSVVTVNICCLSLSKFDTVATVNICHCYYCAVAVVQSQQSMQLLQLLQLL